MDLRTGAAFWPLRNGLIHTYPALTRDEQTEVAVVGAGITGALVAHRLTAAGADVIVLDWRDVASGSTAATTGLLQYETDTSLGELCEAVGEARGARAYQLGLEAIDSIEALVGEIGDRCGFERRPSLYLASSRRDARTLMGEYERRVRHGFDVDHLSADEVTRRYGIEAFGALYSRGDGQIDAHRFTHRLLEVAAARGARVFDRTTVTRVTAHDEGVDIETDRDHKISARHIVWAAGYEAVEETSRRAGRFDSTWAFVSEPLADFGPWSDRALIWETARPYLYARVTDDDRVMVGGEDERFAGRHENPKRLAKKTATLLARFKQWFPSLDVEVAYSWAGVFSSTKDGLPYIGTTPEHPHAWLALGYGGNGITFSMIAADLIRDSWLGRDNPDQAIFAFDR